MNLIEQALENVRRTGKIDTTGYRLDASGWLVARHDPEARILRNGFRQVELCTNLALGHIEFLRWRSADDSLENLREDARFRIVAAAIGEAYALLARDGVEEAMRQRDEQLEEIRAAQLARADLLAEREQELVQVHIGDQARIRLSGEQSLHGIHITYKEVGEGVIKVDVSWMKTENNGKFFKLENVRILDIMNGSRYEELWNDGYDDLLPHEATKVEQKRRKVKKYRG